VSNPFVAEIRIFGFNFAPTGWATCDGQLLPISQNTALFSLLGTFYGGDGKTTFALPNFQGSAGVSQGQGAGLSPYFVGQQGGSQTVTLLQSEIPVHTHAWTAANSDSTDQSPVNEMLAGGVGGITMYAAAGSQTPLALQALAPAGGSLPHNNMMPFLTLNYCIALQGVFPPRT
jgi:microcystin-dependent protein